MKTLHNETLRKARLRKTSLSYDSRNKSYDERPGSLACRLPQKPGMTARPRDVH